VGLAEYAWDYHEAGSMAGFGPLEMTDELRQVVARIIGAIPDEGQPGLDESGQPPQHDTAPAQKSAVSDSTSAAAPTAAIDREVGRSQESPMSRPDVAGSQEQPAPPAGEYIAVQQQAARRENMPSTVRRSHGGALPK
jgi:hypothetical protein